MNGGIGGLWDDSSEPPPWLLWPRPGACCWELSWLEADWTNDEERTAALAEAEGCFGFCWLESGLLGKWLSLGFGIGTGLGYSARNSYYLAVIVIFLLSCIGSCFGLMSSNSSSWC